MSQTLPEGVAMGPNGLPQPARNWFLYLFHRNQPPLHISKQQFQYSEAELNRRVKDHFGIKPTELIGFRNVDNVLKSYADIARFFASEPANQNRTFIILQIIVVRMDSHGRDSHDDFAATPRAKVTVDRPVNQEYELRKIYTPEIALQEFVDNSLQYTSNTTTKIIDITLDMTKNRVVIFDSGAGIPASELLDWAEPGHMTETTDSVVWSHAKDASLKSLSKPASDFRNLFKHTEEHAKQRGFLNWYGLGSKLAAANMAGVACTVRMISKSKISPKINYAKFTPGLTATMEEGTHDVDVTYPEGFTKGSTFALVEIENCDFTYLFDRYLDTEEDTDAFMEMLLKELANVYYFYLIPEKVLSTRIEQLGRRTPQQALASPQRPHWQVNIEPVWDIRLNGRKVSVNDCFVHQCFSTARCALTFQVQFGCSSSTNSPMTSREITGIVLYFAAHDKRPIVDERATPISEERNVFVLWNVDVLQRTVVFLDFSRTFKPKANKEELDDASAMAKLAKICGETQNGSLRAKMKSFLLDCWNADSYNKVIMNGTTLKGVEVSNAQKIEFDHFYDLTWLKSSTASATMKRERVSVTYKDGGTNGAPLILNLTYPDISGDHNIDGVQVTTRPVPAKDIRKVGKLGDDLQNFNSFRECTAEHLTAWTGDTMVKGSLKIAAGSPLELTFKLLNSRLNDVFPVNAGVLSSYFEEFDGSLSVTITPSNREKPIEHDLEFNRRLWTLKNMNSVLPGVGTFTLRAKLKDPPAVLAKLALDIKVIVEADCPVEIHLEEDNKLMIGKNEIRVSAKDKDGHNALLKADRNLWSLRVESNSLTAVIEQCTATETHANLSVELSGRIGRRKCRVKVAYRGPTDLVDTQEIEVSPGTAKHLHIDFPTKKFVNHDRLPAPTAHLTDPFGNKVNVNALELRIEDDLVPKGQKVTGQNIVHSRLWAPNAAASIARRDLSVDDAQIPSFADPSLFSPDSKLTAESFVSSTSVCGVSVAVGDAVLLKLGTNRHMIRVQSIAISNGEEYLVAEYFNSTLAYGNTIDDLNPNEIVMSSQQACFVVSKISECQKYHVVSKGVFEAFPIRPESVLFCERIKQSKNRDCESFVVAAAASAKGVIHVSAIYGHQLKPQAIKLDTTLSDSVLFENSSFSDFCRAINISLDNFTASSVVCRCAVTYNGRLLDSTTTIGQLGLRNGVPFVFSYMRAALDEYNQTVRLVHKVNGLNQSFWNEYRCTVLPGPRPFALRVHITKSNPKARGILDSGATKLRVSRGLLFSVQCEILDEANNLCNVKGALLAFSSEQAVKGGKCRFDISVDETDQKHSIEFKAEGIVLSKHMKVECLPRPAVAVHIEPHSCAVDSELTLKVAFEDENEDVVDRPTSPSFRVSIPARLLGEKSQQLRDVEARVTPKGRGVELTCGPLKGKSGKYDIEVSVSDDEDGFEFEKQKVKVKVTPGPAHHLEIHPRVVDGLRSGAVFPDLSFRLFDSYNNQRKLSAKELRLTVSDGVRLKPVWDEENASGLVLRQNSLLCLKEAAEVSIVAEVVMNTQVSAELVAQILAGAVPHTLHAEFKNTNADTITIFAGDGAHSVELDVFVNDELQEVFPEESYEVRVLGIFPNGKQIEGTTSHPFSANHMAFTEAGVYKIRISIKSNLGDLGPIERTVVVLPGDAKNLRLYDAPKKVTLDVPFNAVLRASDQFGNLIDAHHILLASSLTGVSFETQTSGGVSPYLNTGNHAFVFNSDQEGPLRPGQHNVRLTSAQFPNFVHDIVLVVPAATQMRAAAQLPPKKREPPPPADNSAQLRQLKSKIAQLDAEIQILRHIEKFMSEEQAVWPQQYAEAKFKRVPDLIALPMANLCNFVLTDNFMRDVEKLNTPAQFLAAIRRHVSKQIGFLRWIALDMPGKSQQEFFAENKKIVKKFPQGAYKFIQLAPSMPLQPIPKLNRPLLEQLVVPDDKLPHDVQGRVAVAITSAIKKNCSVHLKEDAFDKVNVTHDPALCLETGELRVKVGQNVTAEVGKAQYNGPVIPVKATQEYMQDLVRRVQQKQKDLEVAQRTANELTEVQQPSPKRPKRN